MIFLNPLSDIAFKKLFANQAKKAILMSFLNSVLNRQEGEKIIDVTITDPYNNPDTEWLKLSIVDVRCVDQAGKNYIVEVQARYQKNYPERSQYYASLAIARQLQNRQQYLEIMPVVFVGILDFELFQGTDCISHHKILNTKSFKCDLTHLEFHFIELPKFKKTLEQLQTVEEKWLYLLRHASELQKIPTQLKNPFELEEAFETLEQGNMSPEELYAYDRFIDAQRVEFDVLLSAKEKGLEEGLQKGLQEGEKKAKLAIAQQLLQHMDVKHVAKLTGLSVQEVQALITSDKN